MFVCKLSESRKMSQIIFGRGWELAHRFSERIARFLRNLLKKTSDLLIHSFLVNDLSDSLTLLINKEGMRESLV